LESNVEVASGVPGRFEDQEIAEELLDAEATAFVHRKCEKVHRSTRTLCILSEQGCFPWGGLVMVEFVDQNFNATSIVTLPLTIPVFELAACADENGD